ncbi:MAG: hypothetical protein ACR2GL_02330 [Thermoleophilaceae bacterium]
MSPIRRAVAAFAALALLPAGCAGGDDQPREAAPPARERTDPPTTPPRGWRTVRNTVAGFTVAVPGSWTSRTKAGRTIIRSDDRLVAVSISADRTQPGRELTPRRYARRTVRELPRFAGRIDGRVTRVPGSSYDSALLTALGTVAPNSLSQKITVAVFQRPGRVTYGALLFRNAGVKPAFNERRLDALLRSFRAQAPS